MLSYLHRYHAGNFADVHKHLTLIATLDYLLKKPTPFCILDTHAGEGLYDLGSLEATKNAEFEQGVGPLLSLKQAPFLITQLQNLIRLYNEDEQFLIYPGSPAIAKHFLRAQDKAILIEKHPQAIEHLRHHFRKEKEKEKQIHIHNRDAWESLLALTPFPEKRGVIFIDPSWEIKSEYQEIPSILEQAYQRFSQGIFILWYPLLSQLYHLPLIRSLQQGPFSKIWHSEWTPDTTVKEGMLGSGIIIINPPWQIDKTLEATFEWLKNQVFPRSEFKSQW